MKMNYNKNFKKTNKRTRNYLNRPSEGFQPTVRRNLVYEDLITIAPGAVRGTYVFRGNSLFDPDYTSTGHQPRYFDTYSTIYSRYRVYGSSIRIEALNAAASGGALIAVTPLTDIITFTTWQQAAELPNTRCTDMIPIAQRYPQTVQHSCRTKYVEGLKGPFVDEDWTATTGANPVNIWYWNINVASTDVSNNVNVGLRVRITYDAQFYERIDITPSLRVVDPEKDHVKKPRDIPQISFNNVSPMVFHRPL
jgi:hypothetical protein